MARERREQFRPTFTRQLTVGIVLCVLGVIPVFVSMIMFGEQERFGHVLGVAVMLALIAVGVLLIVRSSIIWGAYQQLLEEGDYTRRSKDENRRLTPFNTIYWGLVTAGYLAWSFISNDWSHTWIVWPIAGVAYGAILGVIKALSRK